MDATRREEKERHGGERIRKEHLVPRMEEAENERMKESPMAEFLSSLCS